MSSDADFQFVVEDVFSIKGRGTVVTGRVGAGKVAVGDAITVTRDGVLRRKTRVTGIEAFKKVLTVAEPGTTVGLLLADVDRQEIERGDVLARDTGIDVQPATVTELPAPTLGALQVTEVGASKVLPAWMWAVGAFVLLAVLVALALLLS
jgi:translation elongation factor EF-Tu-like GTPase